MTTKHIEKTPQSAQNVPPTEVSPNARRRSFTAEYKRRILKEADACKKSGEIGAILRREGLYSSHLVDWRRARERGDLAGDALPRGPKTTIIDPRIAELERENILLKRRADRAEALVELQKKVAEILGSHLLDLAVVP
jgi:transposase-like protein